MCLERSRHRYLEDSVVGQLETSHRPHRSAWTSLLASSRLRLYPRVSRPLRRPEGRKATPRKQPDCPSLCSVTRTFLRRNTSKAWNCTIQLALAITCLSTGSHHDGHNVLHSSQHFCATSHHRTITTAVLPLSAAVHHADVSNSSFYNRLADAIPLSPPCSPAPSA